MGVSKAIAPIWAVPQLELAVLIMWLLKDFAWVLLIAPLAWTAAVAAIGLETHSLLVDWKADSGAVRVHNIATLTWILGNSLWMTSELLWDGSSSYDKKTLHSIFPWHNGPLAGVNEVSYQGGVQAGRALFISGLALLAGFYLYAYRSSTQPSSPALSSHRGNNPQDEMDESAEVQEPEPELVWGFVTPKVYVMVFIGPWILKDFFWSCGGTAGLCLAMASAAVVFALVADCYRRFGSMASVIEMIWIFANCIWLTCELGHDQIHGPVLAPRLVAASFLMLGCLMAMWMFAKAHLGRGDGNLEETTPLTGTSVQ